MEAVIALLAVTAVIFAVLYGMYRYTFGRSKRRQAGDFTVPSGSYYEQHRDKITENVKRALSYESQRVTIRSRDGIELSARFYDFGGEGRLAIFFHGYRSSAIRDGNGIVRICADNGYDLLVVDQRAHGQSGGRTITFGIRERFDCLDWIDYSTERFGKEVKIVLMGISMGAATVMMAAGEGLPDNVRCIIEDCGYSSPRDILSSVIKRMKLPVGPVYWLLKLSALIFGGFDPDSCSAAEALKKCRLPVLLIHGEDDRLVPCSMSRVCREACGDDAVLLKVPKAGHGMSFYHDNEGYLAAVTAFLRKGLE